MIYTTLEKIKAHNPCCAGWKTLLKSLNKEKADDTPVSIKQILDSNGLQDTLWYLRCWPEYDREWRLLVVQYARDVSILMGDERGLRVLAVAEDYLRGKAPLEDLNAAITAVNDTGDTWGARAALAAARACSDAAAGTGFWNAGYVASTAWDAIATYYDADGGWAAWDNIRQKQAQLLLETVEDLTN